MRLDGPKGAKVEIRVGWPGHPRWRLTGVFPPESAAAVRERMAPMSNTLARLADERLQAVSQRIAHEMFYGGSTA